MSAGEQAAAAATGDVPVHEFAGYRQALAAIAGYSSSLRERAAARRSRGLSVTDQDYPEESFRLLPRGAVGRPLALVGGMGPLAGALAFRRACERFGNSRPVVLYQACSVPDRTAVILAGREAGPSEDDLAKRLTRAIKAAVNLFPRGAGRVDCIMACNSAHYFWQPLQRHVACAPHLAPRLNAISTVACALSVLRAAGYQRTLLLCTQGARAGRLFSRPAAAAGISFAEPAPDLDRLLMEAIYGGVKSLDEGRAVACGTEFFERVLRSMGRFDCILAGCTELPPLIELLKGRSTSTVRSFLSRVAVLDPLEAALDAAGDQRTGLPALRPRRHAIPGRHPLARDWGVGSPP